MKQKVHVKQKKTIIQTNKESSNNHFGGLRLGVERRISD